MGFGCWDCAWLEMQSEAESKRTKKNMPTLVLTDRYFEQNALITAAAFQISFLPANVLAMPLLWKNIRFGSQGRHLSVRLCRPSGTLSQNAMYPALPCRATVCAAPVGAARSSYRVTLIKYPALPCRAIVCGAPLGAARSSYKVTLIKPEASIRCITSAMSACRK